MVPNLTADTYTIQVEMPSFCTLRRAGVAVSPGSIVALGALTIDTRSRPNGAGFGVATDYQAPRSVQLQARFSF